MEKKRQKRKLSGWPAYVVGSAMILSVCFVFLPLIALQNEFGHLLGIPAVKLLFGGVYDTYLDGVFYSFLFPMNEYLIAIFLAAIFSGIFGLLGRDSPVSLFLSCFLSLLSSIALFFVPNLVKIKTQAIVDEGTVYGVGFYFLIAIWLLCFVSYLVLGIQAKKRRNSKKMNKK